MKAIQLSLFKPSCQLDFYGKDGYFIAYGEDAILAANTLKETVREVDGQPVLAISVLRQSDIVFPKLVRAGYKIKIQGV